jgi:hypothetical protein
VSALSSRFVFCKAGSSITETDFFPSFWNVKSQECDISGPTETSTRETLQDILASIRLERRAPSWNLLLGRLRLTDGLGSRYQSLCMLARLYVRSGCCDIVGGHFRARPIFVRISRGRLPLGINQEPEPPTQTGVFWPLSVSARLICTCEDRSALTESMTVSAARVAPCQA